MLSTWAYIAKWRWTRFCLTRRLHVFKQCSIFYKRMLGPISFYRDNAFCWKTRCTFQGMCIHIYIYMHKYVYALDIWLYCVSIWQEQYFSWRNRVSLYTPMRLYIYIYIHTHTHIYIYRNTHTHIYIYIHNFSKNASCLTWRVFVWEGDYTCCCLRLFNGEELFEKKTRFQHAIFLKGIPVFFQRMLHRSVKSVCLKGGSFQLKLLL